MSNVDILNGEHKTYYSNGKLKESSTYVDCKLHGIFNQYYEDGTLEIECKYYHGVRDELYCDYYPNGNLSKSVMFDAGKFDIVNTFSRSGDTCIKYDNNGKVIKQVYDNILDLSKKDGYNSIVSIRENDGKFGEYYLVYIQDDTPNYLESLNMNSISEAKAISFIISDVYSDISGNEIPFTDTTLTMLKHYFDYGFTVDGEINEDHLVVLKNRFINESFTIVKIDKVRVINKQFSLIRNIC